MKLADLAIYLLTVAVALFALLAIVRYFSPPEPVLLVDASLAQGCARPAPRPQGIPVQPSDARRIA